MWFSEYNALRSLSIISRICSMATYAITLCVWRRRLNSFCTKRSTASNPPGVKFYSVSMKAAKQNVNGVDLFYQQTGTGQHAVMLIPGILGSGKTDFGPQLEALNKDRFTVVSLDPRGYGNSRPPERDFPMDFFERDAKDVVDLMLALHFKQFSLLGWSSGGICAMIAAARNPSLIRKLVVWGSRAHVSEQDMKIFNGLRNLSVWRTRKLMEDVYGAQGFPKIIGACVDCMSQFAQRPDGNICRELLPLISCPTLIVHGEKDPMVPACHPQYLLEHIRDSRLYLMPEGKHNLHQTFATEFNQLVEEFLCD